MTKTKESNTLIVNEMYELKTTGARLIVREQEAEDKTESGIIITNTSAHKPTYTAEVLVTGDGAYLENGTVKPMCVKPGDTIMYSQYAGTPIEFEGEKYLILNERDILVIVVKKEN